MSGIILKQYDNHLVSPRDDAILYDSIIGDSGIVSGGEITYLGSNKIRIGTTRGVIKGRAFTMEEQEIAVDYSTGAEWPGRVYLRMDLMDHDDPLKLLSVTKATLPALVRNEKCNEENGIYEIEIGSFKATQVALTEVQNTAHVISIKAGKDELEQAKDSLTAKIVQVSGLLGDQIRITINGSNCKIERA